MDKNRRRFIRVEADDLLEVRPLIKETEAGLRAKASNVSAMGLCFFSQLEWRKGQVMLIDYFIPDMNKSVKLKAVAVWSEFVDNRQGYLCGCEILDMEQERDEFLDYYFKILRRKFNL